MTEPLSIYTIRYHISIANDRDMNDCDMHSYIVTQTQSGSPLPSYTFRSATGDFVVSHTSMSCHLAGGTAPAGSGALPGCACRYNDVPVRRSNVPCASCGRLDIRRQLAALVDRCWSFAVPLQMLQMHTATLVRQTATTIHTTTNRPSECSSRLLDHDST